MRNRQSCSTPRPQWVMKSLDWGEKGIRVDGKFLLHLRFANDIVIFSKKASEAETMLKELNEPKGRSDYVSTG
ncbi:hypothetical protein KIN20_008006 [Parelaphostrongylus tenuis]|uniref:Reverse transcriptase domain-containing protein n=1 Tax=Parelaphostrongylus tenuis TaxID=148309 RepID=A0AAD5M7C1_PARTN|nr:hypothetical protein KIN20_008006 [Parelaphostrongylus tenuis]